MKFKIRYENNVDNKAPITVEIEVPDDECTVMIEADYQKRLENAEDKSQVTRREVQSIMDEEFNKPLYNLWHKEHRHRGNFKKQFRKDDEDVDESDGIDTVADNSQEEERNGQYEYEALCQQIHHVLKSEYADVIIAVYIDDMTPEEYALKNGLERDAVYKRLQRAKKKMREIF